MIYGQISSTRGLSTMLNKPSSFLRRRRQTLLHQLPPLHQVLRGSLIERYKRCGKPGCKCARGMGHGPKHYLSVNVPGGNPQMDYVPQQRYGETVQWLANYYRIQEILKDICTINRELLRRREAL